MSLLSTIFGGNAQPTPNQAAPVVPTSTVPAAQGTPVQPGNMEGQTVTTTESNGVVPNTPTQTSTQEQKPENPLDKFADLWETSGDDKGNTEQPANNQLTAESMQKALDKVDLTQNAMTPEVMQAIAAGGEDAMKALPGLLNAVAKQTMTQSVLVNQQIMAKEIAKAREEATANIPDLVRQQATANHLKDTNPALTNPAIKPFIDGAIDKLRQKHPNATPQELTDMTSDLMTAISETFQKPAPIDPNQEVDTDWEKFLTS